jgi:ribosomal RNA-processing protein 12
MLKFKAREVVKSTLGFVMVSLSLLPLETMRPHLPALCEGLFHWAHDSHNPFRLKIRVVLERLLRKFGYELPCRIIERVCAHTSFFFAVQVRRSGEACARGRLEDLEGDPAEQEA